MGEMADFALEQVMDEEERRDSYWSGEMSHEEAFENGYLDSSGCQTDYARGRASSRATTANYLEGFAKFYKERGFLSAKQKAIINTNYPGGSEAFMRDK